MLTFLFVPLAAADGLAVASLAVEHLIAPDGVDVTAPRFSWRLVAPTGARGVMPLALQLQVSTEPDFIASSPVMNLTARSADVSMRFHAVPATSSSSNIVGRVALLHLNPLMRAHLLLLFAAGFAHFGHVLVMRRHAVRGVVLVLSPRRCRARAVELCYVMLCALLGCGLPARVGQKTFS